MKNIILLLDNNIERLIYCSIFTCLESAFSYVKEGISGISVRDTFQLTENQHYLQLMVNNGKSRRRDFFCLHEHSMNRSGHTQKIEEFVLHSYVRIYIRRARLAAHT